MLIKGKKIGLFFSSCVIVVGRFCSKKRRRKNKEKEQRKGREASIAVRPDKPDVA